MNTNLPPLPIAKFYNFFIVIVGRIFPLTFGLGGLLMAGIGIWSVQKGMESEGWETVQGTILKSDIKKNESTTRDAKGFRRTNTSYIVTVNYFFEIDDNRYEGNTISFGNVSHSERSDAQKELKSYPKGKEVKVYFNPEDPDDSVLKKGVVWPMWIVIGIGAVILFVSLLASIFLPKLLRKYFLGKFQEGNSENKHPFSE